MITLCWDWGRSRNPTLCSLCAHTKSACAHAACKHNMPFLESEFEFLDAKAISVLPAHGLPTVSGSHRWHTFGRTPSGALLWLQGCREHLEVPSLAAKQAILWLCSSWGLTVLPAVWMLTPWKYPSWSLGLTDVVNPTSQHSYIQGIFTRLWQRGGFIMIRDALLQFMPFSCLQPQTDGRVMNPNAVTCRNYFRRSGWKFG